jgi:hypothetical protein
LNKVYKVKKTVKPYNNLIVPYGAESMLSALLDIARLKAVHSTKRQAYPLHDLLSDLNCSLNPLQRSAIFSFMYMMLSSGLIPIHSGFVVLFRTLSVMPYAIPPKGVWWWVYYVQRKTNISGLGLGYRTRIAEEQRIKLFQEFERCGHTSPWGEQGLGWACDRTTDDQPAGLSCTCLFRAWKGSCFMIEVPIVPAPQKSVAACTTDTAQNQSL